MNKYLEQADDLIKDIYSFISPYGMENCETKYIKPEKYNISPNDDEEWVFMRVRMEYLSSLIIAYKKTKDIKYINKLFEIVDEYIYEHKNIIYSLSTRTLDIAIFMENLIKYIIFLKEENLISKEKELEYEAYMKKICDYLFENYLEKYNQSNWGIIQMSSVYMYSIKYNHKDYRKKSFSLLKKQLKTQIEEDGMHYEYSNTYHLQIILCIQNLVELNCSNKIYFLRYLKKLSVAYGKLIYPDGNQINFGDSDIINALDVLDKSYNLMNKKYIKKNHITLFKNSGYFNMVQNDFSVSSYLAKSTSGHKHLDLIHFNYYNKVPIIVDNGRYTYKDTKERYYLKSSLAHNSAIIDNKPYCEVIDSWEYTKDFPKINEISLNKMDKNVNLVTMSYFDIKNSSYIERKLLIIEKNLLIFTNVFCKGKHSCKLYFNLHKDVKIENYLINSKLKFIGKNLELEKSSYSSSYNKIEDSLKITDTKTFKDETFFVNMILEDDIYELDIYRKNEKINLDYVKAYKLKTKLNEYEIFIRNKDEYIQTDSYYVNNEPKYKDIVVNIRKRK